jgi:predicted metalloprotease
VVRQEKNWYYTLVRNRLGKTLRLFEADTHDFWSRFFGDKGYKSYQRPKVETHSEHEGVGPTNCGTVANNNAFFCRYDHTIHVLKEFLQRSFLPTGDFAVGFILAHKWAHAAQQQLGISDDSRLWSIQKELQADCLAGVYTNYAIFGSLRINVEPGDVLEAATGAFSIGDPKGTPPDDPKVHGNHQQRQDAFYAGFQGGFAPCWQYTALPGELPK